MSLFAEELKKLLIKRKLLLLLLLALAVKSGFLLVGAHQHVLFQDQSLQSEYLSYMAVLEGSLNPEKEEFLLTEKSRADESDARLSEAFAQLSTGQITVPQFDGIVAGESAYQNKKPVIEHLYRQYQYIAADPGSRYFIDPVGWSGLLADELPDYLLILAVIVIGTLVFYCEDESRMPALNLTAANGKARLAAAKILITSLVCLILTIGFFMVDLAFVYLFNGLSGFGFPIQSIPFYGSSGKALSLGSLLLRLLGLRVLGVMLLVSLVLLLYLCSRSAIATLTTSLAIAVIPPFVFGMNGLIFRLPLPMGYLIGNGFYRGSESLWLDDGKQVSLKYLFQEVPDTWFAALVLVGIVLIAAMLVACVLRFASGKSRGVT